MYPFAGGRTRLVVPWKLLATTHANLSGSVFDDGVIFAPT